MCVSLCFCFAEFLPYICLVTIPFYGSFCGIEVILRLSLFLYIYIAISECIPKVLHFISPYLNLVVLLLVLLYVPVNLIPYPVIWLYEYLLWVSDPLLLINEVVLALNFTMHCSRRAVEKIEEDEEEAWKWKVLLTIFSALCYAIIVSLGLAIYKEGSNAQFWMLLIVICSSIVLAAHNMMWMSHEGIISDVAFTSLCSMVVIYAMKEEVTLIHQPIRRPETWYNFKRNQPLFYLSYEIINTTIDNARVAIQYLKQYISPLFLSLLGVRLYSILFLIQRVIKNFGLEDEESFEEEEMETGLSPWRSPVIVKYCIVFMVTQSTTRLFYHCSGVGHLSESDIHKTQLASMYDHLVEIIWPADILYGRILQVLMVNVFYIWRLYCADDWQWSDWFSA